ncbi:MAG TPA: glycosyltransferase 87 family protein [Micromonosporaceae bacterium]|nr:glycosyltransferase 87 family protein [Micromonosporaceae bacterium]
MPATVAERLRGLLPDHRVRRRFDRWLIVRLGIIAGAIFAAVMAVRAFGRPYVFFDLRIYHGAVVWWAGGGDLYQYVAPGMTIGFTYPPFAAILMRPMTTLSIEAAAQVNEIASYSALAFVLAVLLVPIADRCGWPRWFAVGVALPLAAATEPVRETIGYGQVNLLLFGLIIADLVALRRRHRTSITPSSGRTGLYRLWTEGSWAGVGIGLATAIKLTPALFIVYLLISKQWRAATTAAGTALAVTIGAFLVAGRESTTYFTSVMWDTGRVGVTDMTPNQSLAGLLARLYDSAETPGLLWLAFAMLMLVLGLSRAANAHAEGDELAAFTLVGLTANVISPISWTHHLVFVLPAIIVLLDSAMRRRAASRGLRPARGGGGLAGWRHGCAALGLFALFVISPVWLYEHQYPEVSHYADGLFGALAENSFAIALIALVAALPWRPGADPAFYPERRFGAQGQFTHSSVPSAKT